MSKTFTTDTSRRVTVHEVFENDLVGTWMFDFSKTALKMGQSEADTNEFVHVYLILTHIQRSFTEVK